jgi:hypothetical protein
MQFLFYISLERSPYNTTTTTLAGKAERETVTNLL